MEGHVDFFVSPNMVHTNFTLQTEDVAYADFYPYHCSRIQVKLWGYSKTTRLTDWEDLFYMKN